MLRRFRDDESGNAAIEILFCVPIMVWALLSTMVYFDAYHDEAISTRAGLTIADMVSREDAPITPSYLNATRQLLRSLTETENNPDFRITVFEYREPQDDYRVVWSRNRGWGQNYNDARLALVKDRLPMMADATNAILVETRTTYNAPFSVTVAPFMVQNLEGVEFNSFTVISPRFASSICWQQSDDSEPDCNLSDL
ncbi:hypothetical protein [Yoonia sp. SS1-5]|uniref:TadE/TadG family type IV pilus assembly protein n=1 Tax=Yoonia rhodophyticola TaxID=3137370 RepID=A0AAN0MCX4_9RHOB